jgi:hypothetical protein
LLVQIAAKPHRPVRDVNPDAPPALATLIDRCLAKKPEDRLPSLNLAAVELSSILRTLEPGRRLRPLAAAIAAAALTIAAAGGWLWEHRSVDSALHTVRYSLQNEQGMETSPETTFRGGARFRFDLRSSNSGFLYVINEGPGEKGRNRFYVLFPRPGGSAAAPANEQKLTGWLAFDENPGTERMWIVWSNQPLASLEQAVSGPARGLVKEGEQPAIETLLGSLQAAGKISHTRTGNEIQVESAGNTLGTVVELKHR